MTMPVGIYVISNVIHRAETFMVQIGDSDRASLWKRAVALGANNRVCTVTWSREFFDLFSGRTTSLPLPKASTSSLRIPLTKRLLMSFPVGAQLQSNIFGKFATTLTVRTDRNDVWREIVRRNLNGRLFFIELPVAG